MVALVIDPDVANIEEVAFAAWPAAEVRSVGPWRLRFMSGVTSRGNSVWVGSGEPAGGLGAGVLAVEDFYRDRGLPPQFQMGPLADVRLDPLLAARGYERRDPVSVQVADAVRVASLTPRAEITTSCEATLPERWFEVSGRRGRFQGDAIPVYRGLLERLVGRGAFASALDDEGEVVAVGLAALAGALAGISSMLTLPTHRGRGFGAAILGELARFCVARAVKRLYLQVERDNAPALRLYQRTGFTESHGYEYRRR